MVLIGIVAIVLLVALSTRRGAPVPQMQQFVFTGFTNFGVGAEAVFLVRYPPTFSGCGYGALNISTMKAGEWQPWVPGKNEKLRLRWLDGRVRRDWFGNFYDSHVAIRVEDSYLPSRITLVVDDSPPNRFPIFGPLGKHLNRLLGRTNALRLPSRYILTNETRTAQDPGRKPP